MGSFLLSQEMNFINNKPKPFYGVTPGQKQENETVPGFRL
jgi:hypothetical protein